MRNAAEQSIEWYPWGEEAFELARRTNRPILLDVGASWCHWCHVMDEGTYSDAEVARLLRQHFVSVKVDRDQNPEIDRRYQRQVSALTGEGGWPLTGFLTPDGEVFLGGTYFPPQDGLGRPGFRRVLKEVARLWKEEPERIRGNAASVKEALERMQLRPRTAPASFSSFVEKVRDQLTQSYDAVHGGFGFSPKFPHPTAISFLMFDSFQSGSEPELRQARETLLRMADGGMYDQLGGGFHRYSVDEGWHIPHFEKMGVDNAALLSVYAEGSRRFEEARFLETVRGSTGWILTALSDPSGGFGASQDADNAPGDDGGYFTWSRSELKAVLSSSELRLVSRYFGVGSEGRMPHDPDRNVLFRLMSAKEAAEGTDLTERQAERELVLAQEKLRSERSRRPAPQVDRALYADLNGGFIRALVQASVLLGDPIPLAQAKRTADRFLDHAYSPDRGLAHRLDPSGASGYGLLEDQASFALGLVELAGVTLDRRYLDATERLLALIDREFRGDGGLLRDVAPALYDGPSLGTLSEPSYPLEDNPHLSPTAATAIALLRLSSLTNSEDAREKAMGLLSSAIARVSSTGLFAAGLAWAVGLSESPPARVVIEASGSEGTALVRATETTWHPNLWIFHGTPPTPFALPDELSSAASGSSEPRALICFGTHCLAPVTDSRKIRTLLLTGGRPAAS